MEALTKIATFHYDKLRTSRRHRHPNQTQQELRLADRPRAVQHLGVREHYRPEEAEVAHQEVEVAAELRSR